MSNAYSTQVLIIGGGVIGTSLAYHLAKLGCSDVTLLERDRLTSGTTWHAAGLIASGGLLNETALWAQQYSRDLYERLEAETGLATGFRRTGYLQLASSRLRQQVLRREQRFARTQGLDKHEISPQEARDLFPMLDISDVVSALYTPVDGRANPIDVTMSLAAGARQRGVIIKEHTPVLQINRSDGRATGVRTAEGDFHADTVVLCTGMWTRQLAAQVGVAVPLQAAEHYYLLTEGAGTSIRDLPVVEDPDNYAYFRPEGDGLLVGLFEPEGACWNLEGIPDDASFLELPPDWERLTPFLERAFPRMPALKQLGIKKLFCGPESFTPDGSFLVGKAPELDGLYVAAGMNSLGILSGGGIGALLAEWILTGRPAHDVTGIDIARSMPHESTRAFLGERIPAALGYVFSHSSLPEYKHSTARNVRRGPLHERFAARGAYFTVSSGWEVPKWFSQDGEMPAVEHRFERQGWFKYNLIEHQAVRSSLGLIDKTFMAKFIVEGRDAAHVLDRVSANSIATPIGRNVYTQWLNDSAGIVSDLTITRLGETRFLLVASDFLQRSTASWLRDHTHKDEWCTITDVTSGYSILAIQGPKSRDFLQAISGADLSTERVPFRGSCELEIGPARVLAIRVTFVGELGYELYIPTEYTLAVYDALLKQEAACGIPLVHFGLMSLDSLRLEKGYRDYGVDLDNSDTPLEAGLGFVVDFSKDFIGKSALLRQKNAGALTKRLVQILLTEPEPLLFGREPCLRDGKVIGYLRSAAYAHHLGGACGLALLEIPEGVTAETLKSGKIEVECLDGLIPAIASLAPLYDPKSLRVRV
jgi:glycine cleavage system aminomethyltransferase T/glycine/D-amino acid oxidase-like deaminating enzyme